MRHHRHDTDDGFDDYCATMRTIAESCDWPAALAEHRTAPKPRRLLDDLTPVGVVGEWLCWHITAWQHGGRVYAEAHKPGYLFFAYPYDEDMNRILGGCGARFRNGEVRGWVVRVTPENAAQLEQIAHTFHFCVHRDAEKTLRAAMDQAKKAA